MQIVYIHWVYTYVDVLRKHDKHSRTFLFFYVAGSMVSVYFVTCF